MQALCLWRRQTWTSLRLAWWAQGLHTAHHATPLTIGTLRDTCCGWTLRSTDADASCRFVPGGSSSGSGSLVGSGLVSFALGTDTAGSGAQQQSARNVCQSRAASAQAEHSDQGCPAAEPCVRLRGHTPADQDSNLLPKPHTGLCAAGRIPAGFNGCVGIKATLGYVSTAGVVPAARSADCLTCLARTVEDAGLVMRTMRVRPLQRAWLSCKGACKLTPG